MAPSPACTLTACVWPQFAGLAVRPSGARVSYRAQQFQDTINISNPFRCIFCFPARGIIFYQVFNMASFKPRFLYDVLEYSPSSSWSRHLAGMYLTRRCVTSMLVGVLGWLIYFLFPEVFLQTNDLFWTKFGWLHIFLEQGDWLPSAFTGHFKPLFPVTFPGEGHCGFTATDTGTPLNVCTYTYVSLHLYCLLLP